MSNIRWPNKFWLIARECADPGGNAAYKSAEREIEVCYLFAAKDLIKEAPKAGETVNIVPKRGGPTIENINHDEAVYGALWAILFHESGHAIFDMLHAPVFGREEDAADQFAAYLALRFNDVNRPDIALSMIRGFGFFWYHNSDQVADANAPTGATFEELKSRLISYSDEHGSNEQRFYNILCLAYGKDRDKYKEFAGFLEGSDRDCKREYDQVEFAFGKTILPFVK